MPQFRELVLSSESFKRDAKALNERLDQYASERLGKFETEQSIYRFSHMDSGSHLADDVMTLGNDTVRLIHEILWEAAKPVKGHTYRRFKGRFTDILNETFDLYSKEATWGLGKAVSNGLHSSGRIRNSGRSIRGSVDVRVRPPEEGFPQVPSFSNYKTKRAYKPTRRDEADIASQQAKAREPRPVTTHVDTSIIPLPEPNAASVMEYVKKLTAANRALEAEAKAANEKVAELTEALEATKQKEEWAGVVDSIKVLNEVA